MCVLRLPDDNICTQALFKWRNRRSQRERRTWQRFPKRLRHQPLPRPPAGFELVVRIASQELMFT